MSQKETPLHICVHGHFYQPPRENPWLDEIELQPSAAPFKDWNERINEECYQPNATARILNKEDEIVELFNNYAHISFNVGPTLLRWMKRHAHETYEAIKTADRKSLSLFSGHGAAMAQSYNHIIMPLANRRDKWTQVRWGIQDFRHHFGRMPEGMWLAETAVDLESLDIMAEQGIRFTLLAPRQAHRVRPLSGGAWEDVSESRIDPKKPYLVRLPSGRSMNVFFYDGPTSQAVAFEHLLHRGEDFAHRLVKSFANELRPQLVHIATDGETYGHHHRFGEMALAYALQYIDEAKSVQVTNYSAYLAKFPPQDEVEIFENSSWSCVHGVERWRSDCGCRGGRGQDWKQDWRAPLREALDALRDQIATLYVDVTKDVFEEPWSVRDDYISIVLDPSEAQQRSFLQRHAKRSLEDIDIPRLLSILECQRQAMLMYTSCGWFFDEISDLETVQILRYAGRAIQLARDVFGVDMRSDFLAILSKAPSNQPQYESGREVYEQCVETAVHTFDDIVWMDVCRRILQPEDLEHSLYGTTLTPVELHSHQMGRWRLLHGQIKLVEWVTRQQHVCDVVAFDVGMLQPVGCCMKAGTLTDDLLTSLKSSFWRADTMALRTQLSSLDGQLMNHEMLDDHWEWLRHEHVYGRLEGELEQNALEVFDLYAPLMSSLGASTSHAYMTGRWLEIVFEARWRRLLRMECPSVEALHMLLEETEKYEMRFDFSDLTKDMEALLFRLLHDWEAAPMQRTALRRLCVYMHAAVQFDLIDSMGKKRALQDRFYGLWQGHKGRRHELEEWEEWTTSLARALGFHIT